MAKFVLLGDSIFDNAPYVEQGYDVCSQLRAMVEPSHQVVLVARDGAVLADMRKQIDRVCAMAQAPDHLFVSCGGNDVLALSGAMHTSVRTLMEGAGLLTKWQNAFSLSYCAMLEQLATCGMPFTVSTIYDAVPGLAPALRTALAIFNDVIIVEAARRGVPVLDLRFICDLPLHFAAVSPIEPSEDGAARIAAALGAIAFGSFDTCACIKLYTGPGGRRAS